MSFDFSKLNFDEVSFNEGSNLVENTENNTNKEVSVTKEVDNTNETKDVSKEKETKKKSTKSSKSSNKNNKSNDNNDNKSEFKVSRDRPVIAYGELVYVEKDKDKSLDDIRKTLVDTYGFSEFSDNSCEMEYNLSTGEVVPKIKFQRKG